MGVHYIIDATDKQGKLLNEPPKLRFSTFQKKLSPNNLTFYFDSINILGHHPFKNIITRFPDIDDFKN